MKKLSVLLTLILFLYGCTGAKIKTCSDYFRSCPNPKSLTSCDKLSSPEINLTITEIEGVRGPIDTLEVFDYLKHREKHDSLSVANFKMNSRSADAIYWFKIGTERGKGYRSGSIGIISVKGCSIKDILMVETWVYDDIALLHNKAF